MLRLRPHIAVKILVLNFAILGLVIGLTLTVFFPNSLFPSTIPLILNEKDKASWNLVAYGYYGTLGDPTLERFNEENKTVLFAIPSASAGAKASKRQAGVIYDLHPAQDWSTCNYFSVTLYGGNSSTTWQIDIYAPDYSNVFRFSINDDFLGWRTIQIPFTEIQPIYNPLSPIGGAPSFYYVTSVIVVLDKPGIYGVGTLQVYYDPALMIQTYALLILTPLLFVALTLRLRQASLYNRLLRKYDAYLLPLTTSWYLLALEHALTLQETALARIASEYAKTGFFIILLIPILLRIATINRHRK